MAEKRIVIWGAGRIGRGFVGDLFSDSGYQLVFVDEASPLVDQLVRNGHYTVVRATSETKIERVTVQGYEAYHSSQKEEIEKAIVETDLVAVAVFPQNFESVAHELASLIQRRRTVRPQDPINIILCTNLIHAGPIFQKHLHANLTAADQEFFTSKVGVVESLVIRIAPNPPQAELASDPLVVWTNGYSVLPVEEKAFKGAVPAMKSFRLVKDMRSEERRKIYTYNMCHAVLSYHGYLAGHPQLVDCLADPVIRTEAQGALDEVSKTLQLELGFSESDMAAWVQGVIEQTDNRTVGDTVVRSAADPLRKLHRDDRLIGPALLCLKNGIPPVHLIKAIGAAFHYRNTDDANSLKLSDMISQNGLNHTIRDVCGLGDNSMEVGLAKEIEHAYYQVEEDMAWREKAQKAYALGFEYEKVYHGCGQCVFAAVSETLECFDPETFKAATGLCGGVGLKTDCSCSAFAGGVMAIGKLYPRRRENFGGDRESKYTNFALVQQLHDRIIQEYGSIICAKIHEKKYGRSYDLSNKEDSKLFEAAGAHGNTGCTDVVGKVAQWTVEILAPVMKTLSKE
jgi:mannitol-1-phosphate 5-dehydrogenase